MKKSMYVSVLLLFLLSFVILPIQAAEPYKDGDILYEADFSNFELLSVEKDFRAYGLAYDNGGTEILTCEGGKLLAKSLTTAGEFSISGRFGTRLRFYDVPDNVKRFSVTVDIHINEFLDQKNSFGPALLIADNGISDPTKTDPASMFSMIWLRIFDIGTTGAYTYGDTALNVVSKSEEGFCLPDTTYTIQVYIDVEDSSGVFNIINKTTGNEYFAEYFYYNLCDVDPMVGIMVNGCDVEVDNLVVYYGDGIFDAYTSDNTTEEDNTTEPIESTTPTETTEPSEEETTDGSDDTTTGTEKPKDEKEGCGSSASAVIFAVPIFGLLLNKKKRK